MAQPIYDEGFVVKPSSGGAGAGPRWKLFAAGDYGPSSGGNAREGSGESPRSLSGGLADRINKADLAIVNLEAPLRLDDKGIKKVGPSLGTDESALSIMKEAGFSAVGLANNHFMDNGYDSALATQNYCRHLEMETCGFGDNIYEALKPAFFNFLDIRVGVLSLCEMEFGVADTGNPGTAWVSDPLVESVVASTKKEVDVLVVLAHGGIERVPLPPANRKTQLRNIVNWGADIVVGHHPHVPQGWEEYGGGYIFYSLGNFFLDYGKGRKYPKTDWGIALEVEFVSNEIDKICLLPVERANGSVDFMKRESSYAAGWRNYLLRCSEVVSDDSLFYRYWNILAVDLIERKYEPYFSAVFHCPVSERRSRRIRWHLRNLAKELVHLVRNGNRDVKTMDDLVMLNLIRNESARNAIVTGLEERSRGLKKESPAIDEDLRTLMEWTGP